MAVNVAHAASRQRSGELIEREESLATIGSFLLSPMTGAHHGASVDVALQLTWLM